jgi:flagellar protein FliS
MQSSRARDQYLFTNVNTATPQKLQLLLIDAALQSAHRAGEYWRQGLDDRAVAALVHAQSVLNEMLAVIDRHAGGEVAARVSAVYDFIFHALVRASSQHDARGLADAVRVLEFERETWRQVCEKIATDQPPPGPAAPHARFGAPIDSAAGDFAGGLSLEA